MDREAYTEAKALHKKNPDLGEKQTIFSNEILLEYEDAKDLVIDEEVCKTSHL